MKVNVDVIPSLELDKEIVLDNIEMVEGYMRTMSNRKSVGDNTISGYADRQTGRILCFGNIQDIPKEIKNRGIEFSFGKAVNLDAKPFLADFNRRDNKPYDLNTFLTSFKGNTSKIVGSFDASKFSEIGRKNIEVTIQGYNAKH